MTEESARLFSANVRANLLRFFFTGPVVLFTVHVVHAHLSASEYGLWALLSLPATQPLHVDFGGFVGLTRLVGHARGQEAPQAAGRFTLAVTFFYVLWIVALGLGGAAAWSAGLVPVRGAWLALALAGYALGLASVPLQALLAGHERVDLQNVILTLWVVITAGLVWGAASRGLGGVLAAQVAANALLVVLMAGTVAGAVGWPAFAWPDGSCVRQAARECGAAYAVGLYNLLFLHGDKLTLGAFAGLSAVGSFDVGSRLPGYVRLLAAKVVDPILPVAARLSGTGADPAPLFGLLARAFAQTAWIWAGGAAGLALFADDVLKLWLGRPEPGAALALAALSLAYALHSFGIGLAYLWTARGQVGRNLAYVGVGSVLWAAGSLLGTAAGGLPGALAGFLCSATLTAGYFAYASYVALGRPPSGGLNRSIAAAVASAAIAAAAGAGVRAALGSFPGMAAFGLVYIAGYVLRPRMV